MTKLKPTAQNALDYLNEHGRATGLVTKTDLARQISVG